MCEREQVEQARVCEKPVDVDWTEPPRDIMYSYTHTETHEMLSNSHSQVNRRRTDTLSEHRDTKCKIPSSHFLPLLWQTDGDEREMMTKCLNSGRDEAFNGDGRASVASLLEYRPTNQSNALDTESKHKHSSTAARSHRRNLHLGFCVPSERGYQRDLRTNPCVYLPLSVRDRWAD